MQQTYGGAPPAPQPIPPAPVPAPARQGDGLSRVLSILAVILSVVALVMSFAIPGATGSAGAPGAPGEKGDKGEKGDQGDQGIQGSAGPAGTNGVNGINGMNGLNCWDLNGNGTADMPDEDTNLDGVVNVSDCKGLAGPGATIFTAVSYSTTAPLGATCTNFPAAEVTVSVSASGTIVVNALVQLRIEHTNGITDSWYVALGADTTDCSNWPYAWVGEIPSDVGTDVFVRESGYVQSTYSVTAGTYTYYVNGYMIEGQNSGDVFFSSNTIAVFYPS